MNEENQAPENETPGPKTPDAAGSAPAVSAGTVSDDMATSGAVGTASTGSGLQADGAANVATSAHPAHGILSEIEDYFAKAESIAEADYDWLKTKLAAIRAHL